VELSHTAIARLEQERTELMWLWQQRREQAGDGGRADRTHDAVEPQQGL